MRSWFSRTFAREIFSAVFCLSASSTASGRDSFNGSAETCPAPKSVQHTIIVRIGAEDLAVLDLTTVKRTGMTSSVKNMEKYEAEGHDARQRAPKARPGEDHGDHTHGGSHGGEEDRPQPPCSRFPGSLFQTGPFSDPFVAVVDQNDAVSYDDAAQADDPHEGSEAERIVGDQEAEHCPEQGKRDRGHHYERFGNVPELHQQNQEDRQ